MTDVSPITTRARARLGTMRAESSTSRARMTRVSRRRTLTRCISLAFAAYAAWALSRLDVGFGLGGSSRDLNHFAGAFSGECVARAGASCALADLESAPIPRALALVAPDPDPESGKSRYYSANHWFHVCEFHIHNHARLRAHGLLPPGDGPDARAPIILQLADPEWLPKLVPMTRLLLALAYTDGTAASIAYAPPGTLEPGRTNSPASSSPSSSSSPSIPPRRRLACDWSAAAWRASPSQPTTERFVVPVGVGGACEATHAASIPSSTTSDIRATRTSSRAPAAMGAVKAERGDWAPTSADVDSMRRALRRLCAPAPGEDEGSEVRSGSNPRAEDAATSASAALESQPCAAASDGDGTRHAVIYQRDVGRSLEDVEGAASSLERALGADWRVSVVTHHERLPPSSRALPRSRRGAGHPARVPVHALPVLATQSAALRGVPAQVLQARVQTRGARVGRVARDDAEPAPLRGVPDHLRGVHNRRMHVHVLLQIPRAEGRRGIGAQGRGCHRSRGARGREGGADARWIEEDAPEGLKNTARAECLAACAANHSCQRFRVASADGEGEDDADEGACELRVDPEQGERDGDVIGAGIYNNKCWVPGC